MPNIRLSSLILAFISNQSLWEQCTVGRIRVKNYDGLFYDTQRYLQKLTIASSAACRGDWRNHRRQHPKKLINSLSLWERNGYDGKDTLDSPNRALLSQALLITHIFWFLPAAKPTGLVEADCSSFFFLLSSHEVQKTPLFVDRFDWYFGTWSR